MGNSISKPDTKSKTCFGNAKSHLSLKDMVKCDPLYHDFQFKIHAYSFTVFHNIWN